MQNAAVIICEKENRHNGTKNWFKSLIYLLKKLFIKKKKEENWVSKIELYENFNLFIIKLPYSSEEISGLNNSKLEKLKNRILELKKEKFIQMCLYSDKIPGQSGIEDEQKYHADFRSLNKLLFLSVLETIYLKNGIAVNELDIVIVKGETVQDVLGAIRALLPYTKYLTVLAENTGMLENETDGIYEETGLSVRLSCDFKNCMKNADFIINFGGLSGKDLRVNINPRAIILNCAHNLILNNENIVINEILINLPFGIISKLDKELLEHFKINDISQLILLNMLNDIRENTDSNYNSQIVYKATEYFKKSGYTISGFAARHSIIRADNILKASGFVLRTSLE